MRQYITFFKIKILAGLQYRSAALAGMVTQLFWGIMYILMFAAFYRSNSYQAMTFSEVVCYVWLNQAFLALFMLWRMDNEIFDSIQKGNVVYELCRPLNIYWMWFSKNAATRISSLLLRCGPIIIVSFFVPEPYGLIIPNNVVIWGAFIISMILAFMIVLSILMLIYILTFYTISATGIRTFLVMLIDFLSGVVIPLAYFPTGLLNIIKWLPFASMQDTPFRIYSGNIAGIEIWKRIGIQFFWVVILIWIGNVVMKKALTKVVIQGG